MLGQFLRVKHSKTCHIHWISSKRSMKKKRDNSRLMVAVHVTRPLDGLRPNRSYTSSSMMWGRSRYNYIGRPHAMDNDILKSRCPPWCGDVAFWCCNKGRQRPQKSIVEVRYYSTVWTPVKSRRCKTRLKLVLDFSFSCVKRLVGEKFFDGEFS